MLPANVPTEDLPLPNSPNAARFGAKDIGWQALGPAIACSILSTVVVAMRWYTRCRLVRCLGFDDYVIMLSLILSWAMCAIITVAVEEGIGAYGSDLNLAELTKLIVANNNVWALTVNVTKASILMQYLRIFNGRTVTRLCYCLLALLLPAVFWAVFGGTFRCRPVAKLWEPHIPGQCFSAQVYWHSVAGIDITLDFLILLLPMPAISGLHLPRKQKTSMILVFGLGFFVCAISVVRLLVVAVTSKGGDFVVSGVWAIIWSVVEANVGIICASLLALRPLIAELFPRLMEETETARHSMRLPRIQTSSARPSHDMAAAIPRSGSVPLSPMTSKSAYCSTQKHSSVSSEWSKSDRTSSWTPYPVTAGIMEDERPPTRSSDFHQEATSTKEVLRADCGHHEVV